MNAPFIQPSHVKLAGTFGDDLNPHIAPIGARGFWLEVNGYDPVRCQYEPTYGYEGFGARKHRVRYPSGKISLTLGNRVFLAVGLDDAKAIIAHQFNKGT